MPLNILLVDDDENILFLVNLALEESGFGVETAATGAEALMLIKSQSFDLVLLDYKLSDLDGLSLAKEIHKIDTKIKIIIVTGNMDLQFYQNEDQLISKILLKPVTEEDLVAEIETVFDQENVEAEAF